MSTTDNESMYEDHEIAPGRPFSPPSSKKRAPGYMASIAAWRSPPNSTFTFDSIGDANVSSICACIVVGSSFFCFRSCQYLNSSSPERVF
jgi:hypothetical protein